MAEKNTASEIYRPTRYELDEAARRCKNAGVDAAMSRLPSSGSRRSCTPPIQMHALMLYKRKLKTHYERLFGIAASFGIAHFLVGTDLHIYNSGGDAELLAELKAVNFRIGTDLSENRIGFNAVSLCHSLFGKSFLADTIVTLDAGESYADVLKPYIFFAVETRSYVDAYGTQYHLIVMRGGADQETCLNFVRFVTDFNECLIAKAYYIPPLEFTKALRDYKDTILIFTNEDGYITLVNDRFCDLMNADTPHIGGHLISDIIPSARSALYSAKAGKDVYMRSIQMQNASGESETYFMDAVGISKDDKINDIMFCLREVKEEKRRASRLVSSGTFFSFDDIVGGNSAEFEHTKELARRIAAGNSNVLISGESGTGKELFAQSIHHASSRRNQPFVSINCAAIPKELISSELFGYDEGAFTGAKKTGAPGKFEIADGGTIFLDEIGEMPIDMQSVLLRVIEEQRITRLGSSKSKKIDVRIIAASNRNLLDCISNHSFRADLYYRINVLQLTLLPLRGRKEDIPLLAEHFLRQFGNSVTGISDEALDKLMAYNWPGNIRELRNIMERAVNVCSGTVIQADDVLVSGTSYLSYSGALPVDYSIDSINRKFDSYEIERINELIVKYNNNKTLVAKELGISRRTLYNKLKRIEEQSGK